MNVVYPGIRDRRAFLLFSFDVYGVGKVTRDRYEILWLIYTSIYPFNFDLIPQCSFNVQ